MRNRCQFDLTDPGESASVNANSYTRLSDPVTLGAGLLEVENERWMHFGTLYRKVA
jgi:hypothetical protein